MIAIDKHTLDTVSSGHSGVGDSSLLLIEDRKDRKCEEEESEER